MRDRILQSQAILDLDDLRRDILELGLKCWGKRPWEERAWELSEMFVEKWWFLVDVGIVEGRIFGGGKEGRERWFGRVRGGVMRIGGRME